MGRRGAVGYCKLEKASLLEQTSQLESEGKRKQASLGGWFQEEDRNPAAGAYSMLGIV